VGFHLVTVMATDNQKLVAKAPLLPSMFHPPKRFLQWEQWKMARALLLRGLRSQRGVPYLEGHDAGCLLWSQRPNPQEELRAFNTCTLMARYLPLLPSFLSLTSPPLTSLASLISLVSLSSTLTSLPLASLISLSPHPSPHLGLKSQSSILREGKILRGPEALIGNVYEFF
jgi:hypothetical protein